MVFECVACYHHILRKRPEAQESSTRVFAAFAPRFGNVRHLFLVTDRK